MFDLYRAIEKIDEGNLGSAKNFITRYINTTHKQEIVVMPKTEHGPIVDIEKMPGYKYVTGFKGINSVATGRVFLKEFEPGIYPAYYRHGAILCIAIREDGAIWRCREEGCDEGCFEPKTSC